MFSQPKLLSVKSDKRYSGSKYEEDHSWLYLFHTHGGWMCKICEKYPYSGGSSNGAFRQHERSERHVRLEKKTIGSGSKEMTDTLVLSKAQNIYRQYANRLYLSKCIDYIFHDKETLAINR